jgi:hypothetical protein
MSRNYIRVDDGDIYMLDPEIDPAELTSRLAIALEGGDSVTVGIDLPGEQDKAAVLVVGRSAACVVVTTIENE